MYEILLEEWIHQQDGGNGNQHTCKLGRHAGGAGELLAHLRRGTRAFLRQLDQIVGTLRGSGKQLCQGIIVMGVGHVQQVVHPGIPVTHGQKYADCGNNRL